MLVNRSILQKSIIVLLALFFCFSIATSQELSVFKETFLRSESSSASNALVKVPDGTDVAVLMLYDTDGWYPVKYRTILGWIDRRHVMRTTVGTVRGSGSLYLVVTAKSTPLREKASNVGKSLITFRKDSKIYVDESRPTKSWYKVSLLNGVNGWIAVKDVTLETTP